MSSTDFRVARLGDDKSVYACTMLPMPMGGSSQLQVVDLWEISYTVTRLFTDPERNADPPFAAVLHLLSASFGWEVAAFWIVNELRVTLECVEFHSEIHGSVENFETVTRSRRFSVGEGIPGTVWAERELLEVPDLSSHPNFPRASVATLDGLKAGLAFPLYVGKKVVGVIEMYRTDSRATDPAIKTFLYALGGQLGVFIERLSAGRALEAADAQFRLVAEAASVTVFTIDENSIILFTNSAVEELFGYTPAELIGAKLTMVMPQYLRHVHEHGLARYVATGQRHISWDGVLLPGLHKDGTEIPLTISFGEFTRDGKRVFTGFAKKRT
jgi:PAS domain S-box-containing protein